MDDTMRTTRWSAIALTITSVVLVSCGLGDPPGRAMSMDGTTWEVTTIDGRATVTDPPPSVSFDENGIDVSLWTGCRDATTSYGLDTDGAALSFGPVDVPSDSKCGGPSMVDEEAFINAINSTQEWTIENVDKVRFIGRHEMVLARQ